MKTIRVEDELHREIKRKAVDTDETLEQLAARYLREGLQREAGVAPTERPKGESAPVPTRKPGSGVRRRVGKAPLPSADELEAEVERIEAEARPKMPRSISELLGQGKVQADDVDEPVAPDALESVKEWLGDDYVPAEEAVKNINDGLDAVQRYNGPFGHTEAPDGRWIVEGQHSDPDGQLVTPFFKITEDGVTRWEDYEKEELPAHVVSMLELELASAKPKIRLKAVKE